MRDDELYERLRDVDPAAGIDRDPGGPRAQRVKDRAIGQARQAPRAPRGGVPRKRLVATLAAAMMTFGGIAVATGVFQPDPADVSGILEEAEESGRYEVKTEGWRPNLRTEQVWCAYEGGVVGSTRTFEFSLDEPMTEDHLIAACTSRPDEARHRDVAVPSDFTVCEAYTPQDELRRAIGTPGRWSHVDGDVTANRPGFPVVLGWAVDDCTAVDLDTNSPAVDLRQWRSMDTVNAARQVEIGVTAAALEDCLSPDDAHAMAHQARSYLEGDWVIAERDLGTPACARVWVDPQLGVLEIGSQR